MFFYTPEEARKTLPLVKKIVNDILNVGQEMRYIAAMSESNPEENAEFLKLRSQLKVYLDELEELNCYYKDWNFNVGLVDFPAIINSEEVFLCWQNGEEDILYYHSLDEGFQGRKLIPEEINER